MLDRFLVLRLLVVLVLFALGGVLAGCPASDIDEDGFTEEEGDCNDDDASVYPGAPEVCDGVDQDCDTLIDEDFDEDLDQHYDDVACASGTDCDDTAADVNPDEDEVCDDVDHDCDGDPRNGLDTWEYWEDLDGDGFGAGLVVEDCSPEAPDGFVEYDALAEDCDDNDGTSYPGATELCDDVDHDCDGEPWNGLDTWEYWEDLDDDGFGAGDVLVDCDPEAPDGFVEYDALAEDCDDLDLTSFPGAVEVCDAVDHDCDTDPWNGLTVYEYWADSDADTFGAGTVIQDCQATPPAGHVAYDALAEDCDDAVAAVNPDATEECNGFDDNCIDGIDEGFDFDTDGVTTCGPDGIPGNIDDDCDDAAANVNPNETEVCDGVDNDCDGLADEEQDNDGDGITPCGVDGIPDTLDDDCDDDNPDTYPLAPEICDGEDNDCDDNIPTDEADGDGDTYPACGECDDGNAAINPGAAEVCDGLDTDCDLTTPADEIDGDSDQYIPCTGFVANGALNIVGGDDCDNGNAAINPAAVEVCDAIDQNCDGLIDETFDTDADTFTTCGADGVPGGGDDDCDDTDPAVYPGALELCDGIDNDCDTDIDDEDTNFAGEDYDGDGDEALLCGGSDCDDTDAAVEGLDIDNDNHSTCQGDCDDLNPYVNPDAVESCDGVDNDCNGDVDEADASLVADADGDGFDADGCSLGGTDCDDNDKHVFPDTIYTSGVVPACEPAVYPGFFHEWDYARISLPAYLFDSSTGSHYLYYRGHHDQPSQQMGVSWSTDGENWTKEPGSILGPTIGWDFRNISNPTVAILPATFARPYVMLYHARAESGGLRQVGIATATDPLGPFERLDALTGLAAVTDPVIPPSTDASYLDSGRTLHPAIFWDGTELHAWYNARTAADSTLRVFHAISADGGATWTRSDGDGDGPDVIFEPAMSPIASSRTDQVSLIEDPFTVGEFEFWYTADEVEVGATRGTATLWEPGTTTAVLTSAGDCTRLDGGTVSARGIRYDMAADAYHWYYGGQTDIEPISGDCNGNPCVGTCAGNEDPIYVWLNGGYTASYVGQGTNWAPVVTINTPAAPATNMTFDGTVTDTAPDLLVVTLASSLDGDLGAAVIDATGNTSQSVQSTTWSATVTGLTSGTHTIFVEASDEAGVERSTSISVTVP